MRLHPGQSVDPIPLRSISGSALTLPHPQRITHVQFRRFAGCPMCNLHVHSFVQRHEELRQAGIEELVIFHSSAAALLRQHAHAPFALIGDPDLHLYRQFGVENSWRAVLHLRAWWAGLRGLLAHGVGRPAAGESILGLPADFLLAPSGEVLACHYGRHAYDQWSVDDVLQLAGQIRTVRARPV